MSFCEHCQGQRFDRARVLRTLRKVHGELCAADPGGRMAEALSSTIRAVRALEIPHLEPYEEESDVVH